MIHKYDEPVYLISIVAKILDIHPQTLRQYERENLICPSRSNGRIRLYSERDVDKIKLILRLTRELGVNLAGVDIILRLKDQIDDMEKEIAELRDEVNRFNDNQEPMLEPTKIKLFFFTIFFIRFITSI